MSHRLEQIAGIIRRVVALHAIRVPPDRAMVVNITRVRVSRDLKYADVFVTALSGAKEAVAFLSSQRRAIRRDLQRELQTLHSFPGVRFHVDERSEWLRKLDEMIDRL